MTNVITEQSEWTLTYDYGEGPLQWDTNHELWAAWTMLEASAVTLLANICDALHLTPVEKAKVLGDDGQAAQEAILAERILPPKGLNQRQQQALIKVQQRGHITNGDLQQVHPEVTAETLRLDLVDLVQLGLLRRQGRCRGTVYTAT